MSIGKKVRFPTILSLTDGAPELVPSVQLSVVGSIAVPRLAAGPLSLRPSAETLKVVAAFPGGAVAGLQLVKNGVRASYSMAAQLLVPHQYSVVAETVQVWFPQASLHSLLGFEATLNGSGDGRELVQGYTSRGMCHYH
jgi:hypothetical protein